GLDPFLPLPVPTPRPGPTRPAQAHLRRVRAARPGPERVADEPRVAWRSRARPAQSSTQERHTHVRRLLSPLGLITAPDPAGPGDAPGRGLDRVHVLSLHDSRPGVAGTHELTEGHGATGPVCMPAGGGGAEQTATQRPRLTTRARHGSPRFAAAL